MQNSQWMTIKEDVDESRFYSVCREFDAGEAAKMSVNVCADSRYQMYVNGVLASEGPCQGEMDAWSYDSLDVSGLLVRGRNKVSLRILHLVGDSFTTVARMSKPAFWFEGTLSDGGETKYILSDDSWECFADLGTRLTNGDGVIYSMPPFENVIASGRLERRELTPFYTLSKNSCNVVGVLDKYYLRRRELPQMQTLPARQLTELRRGKDFIEFDAGRYLTAKVRAAFRTTDCGELKIIYSECYSFENERHEIYKVDRTDSSGFLSGPSDTVRTDGTEQVFEPFWYRAFRFIRLEYADVSRISGLELTCSEYNYPLDIKGSFSCSDAGRNKLWDIGINTLRACLHEIIVDCPFYEQQQYSKDSELQMMYLFRLTDDYRVIRKTIRDLAASQTSEGFVLANYPSTYKQIIPLFALHFIFSVYNYVMYTGDTALASETSGVIYKILNCFDGYVNDDGLFFCPDYWQFVDWTYEWDNGIPPFSDAEPNASCNLTYSFALKQAADLFKIIGNTGAASDFERRKAALDENILRRFYDAERGLFRESPGVSSYSQHSIAFAALGGILSPDKSSAMIDKLGDPDLIKCSFAMSYYIVRALETSGRYDMIGAVLDKWNVMVENNCTTWCESTSFPRSECHGWSAVPTYVLPAIILGVTPIRPGFKRVRIMPYADGSLSYANGSVPTPVGNISVSWTLSDDSFTVDIESPSCIEKEILLPDGTSHISLDPKIHLSCPAAAAHGVRSHGAASRRPHGLRAR